jgi:hypothetical protein
MPTEGFFSRWSRLKTEPAPAAPAAGEGAPLPAHALSGDSGVALAAPRVAAAPDGPAGAPARLPTLDDVARLGADSDYSAFVARGVDQSVRRSAMKKLFADPHFNIGDGLDLYMGDYNRPDPIPAAMMSALRHTESFFAQAYPEQHAEKERERLAARAAEQAQSDGAAAACGLGEPAEPAAPADLDSPARQIEQTNPEPLMADTTGATRANEDNA